LSSGNGRANRWLLACPREQIVLQVSAVGAREIRDAPPRQLFRGKNQLPRRYHV